MDVIIQNGTVCTADSHFLGDVVVTGHAITAVTEAGTAHRAYPTHAIIDATDRYVVPGGIDPHTHFDLQQSPRYRACDDFYDGGVAAACGGTTTVIDHMAFGPDGCDLHHQFNVYRQLARPCPIDYSFHGVFQRLDDDILRELPSLVQEEGFPSFKAYTTYGAPMDDRRLLRILKTLRPLNGLLTVHAENDAITNELRDALLPAEVVPAAQATTRPNEAESVTVATLLGLAKAAGEAPVYIVHLSARESLAQVQMARSEGQSHIYVETCPQYLLLTDEKFSTGGPMEGIKYMMAPPLRKAADNRALWDGLAAGDIQVVATDHCPFTVEEKQANVNDFRRCPGGVSGVEERMPLLFSEGVMTGRLTPERFVQVTAANAARIFGVPKKGDIRCGYDADLVIINPHRSHVFNRRTLKTTCHYSPYEDITCRCSIERVFLRGRLIAEHNTFRGERGYGRLLRRRRE